MRFFTSVSMSIPHTFLSCFGGEGVVGVPAPGGDGVPTSAKPRLAELLAIGLVLFGPSRFESLKHLAASALCTSSRTSSVIFSPVATSTTER